MHVSGVFVYPVKSLRGCAVESAAVDALGFTGDRRFLVIDETGRFLTQRTIARMALVATGLTADTLTLSADGAGFVAVPRASDPAAPLRTVSVWKSEGLAAEDCGDDAAVWLSEFLGVRCRLVRAGERFLRPILKPGKAWPGDVVAFADAYPFMAVSEASLADLNDRLAEAGEEPVPMDRFRPSFTIAGAPAAFAEDTWTRIRVGDVVLRAGGPCARCIVTTTDQLTGERGKEPLRTLARYRRDAANPGDVNFGQNFIHQTKSGTIRIGAPVEIVH
jgi:uncharacterized protein YcbX